MEAEQKRSADLKSQNSKDFEIIQQLAKEKLDDELKQAKRELADIKKSVKDTQLQANANVAQYNADILPLESQISDLNLQKDVLVETNTRLVDENRDLASEITVREGRIVALKADEQDTAMRLAELTIRKQDIMDLLSLTERDLLEKTAKSEQLATDYEAENALLTSRLSILQGKLNDTAQQIIEHKADDDRVRDNLSVWQKKLDARDELIRVREQKVAQQEGAILRNSNLLNL